MSECLIQTQDLPPIMESPVIRNIKCSITRIKEVVMAQKPELGHDLRQWAALSWYAIRPAAYAYSGGTSAQPFFIVGSGRCGTTLLRRLLQASPDIHIPPENWAYGKWMQTFRRYRAVLPWNDLVHLLLSKFMGSNQGWFDRYPEDLIYELEKLTRPQRTLDRFIDTVYSYHGRSCGAVCTRWGDKTPLNINSMENILRIFPKAKFIFLLRDPLDVSYSCSFLEQYQGDLIRPAQRWRQAFYKGRAFGAKHPSRLLEVRYEGLVQDPIQNMELITRFLGVEYSSTLLGNDDYHEDMADVVSTPHLQNALRPVSITSIGKGRRELTDFQRRQVASVIGDELVQAGYEPVA